jgi:hypothetical protein
LGQPECNIYEPELVSQAYAQFYDGRGGAVEFEIKEDKQGFGLSKRRKKRGAAQEMIVLLNTLAHNVLVWARHWLSAENPKLAHYGILRFVRDLLQVSGMVELDHKSKRVVRVVLNKAAPFAHIFVKALGDSLLQEHVVLNLREI